MKKPVEWKRIASLFHPYWKQEVQVFAMIFLGALLGLIPPLCTLRLIDTAIPQNNFGSVCFYVGGMIAAALLAGLVGVYQGYLNSLVGEGIVRDIRSSLVSHLHRMPLDFFTSTKTGEIMNRVSSDVDSIDNVVTGTMVTVVTNVFMITTTLVTVFVLNWKLALLSIGIIPFMIFPIWPVGRKMYEVRKKTRQKRDEIEALTQETLSISGITLIKSFVREPYEHDRFFNVGTDLMKLEISLAMVGRWFMMLIAAMVTIGPAAVWLLGGWLAIQKTVTIGIVVTFTTLLNRLYGPASALAGVQVQVVGALAVFERIFEYLDMPEERCKSDGGAELAQVAGKVEFKHVQFSYSENRPALKDVSFVIEPGEMVAFVGPSGAGKTTITQLVPCFYNTQEGAVLVDDHDVKEMNLHSLRSNIGIVTQETYLFHDTIENNLRYARADATDEELFGAAKAANIHDFIVSLPEGYKTIVGERGHKLSGGERQRLAIARVLLKNPKILILDEATSALDSVNEALIQQAFVPLMQGRTSLVIAHRLSTILSADRIFVIEHGELVEGGTHSELIALDGVYANLYRQQFRERESESALLRLD
ncbi:MAG: ABC transporter ATP-binding protein [Cyanobacteria bacterium SZAS-4]|nr:ABC transporter ATP-binding protein [Cyanobacteria bacterium SZAS-4]